jgi:hypothetical protein
MKKEERQKLKDAEYFAKMREGIIEDLKDDRHIAAIAGSIARPVEWIENQLRLNGLENLL